MLLEVERVCKVRHTRVHTDLVFGKTHDIHPEIMTTPTLKARSVCQSQDKPDFYQSALAGRVKTSTTFTELRVSNIISCDLIKYIS